MTMPEVMTCAEAVRALTRHMEMRVSVEHDRFAMLSRRGDVVKIAFYDASARKIGDWSLCDQIRQRILASALIGQDIDAMQAVVDAAVKLVQATRDGDGLEGERFETAVGAYLAMLETEISDDDAG